ncbi:MAG: hypothetical protein ACLFRD_12175 [Nitriliruptoraceae bacterium]
MAARVEGLADEIEVAAWRGDRRLLGIHTDGGWRYPLWQLDPTTGHPLEGLEQLLDACTEVGLDPRQTHWLASRPHPHAGRSLAELLVAGQRDLAVRLARMAGDQS